MKRFGPIVMAGTILGAVLGLGPIERGAVGPAVALAAQGCRPGFHRNVYGYCRRNAYVAPGIYRPYGAYGYRRGYAYRGAYGRRVYGGRVSGGRVRVGRAYGGYRGGFHRRR
jgi:hypothetical protein